MAWIPVHQSLATHWKVLRLSALLSVPTPTLVGNLVLFWLWCVDNAPDGSLADVDAKTIAFAAQWAGDAQAFVDALLTVKLLDTQDGQLALHNWEKYGGRYVRENEAARERMRKRRSAGPPANGNAPAPEKFTERSPNIRRTFGGREEERREEESREEESSKEEMSSSSPAPRPPRGPRGTPPTACKSWTGPEWWTALVSLVGYRPEDHSKAAHIVEAQCKEAGVLPSNVVSHFAAYYQTARIKHGWTDPVRALLKTLPLEISKELKTVGKGHMPPPPDSIQAVLGLSEFEIDAMGRQGVWASLEEVFGRDREAAARQLKEWRARGGKP